METKSLKKYAPEARRDFIAAVKNKAAVYGLLPKEILPMQEEGDVVIIGDRPFPRSVAKQRKKLEERIRRDGFDQFIEAIAYTWFNRFVAIRYMELHGYLGHSYRVLSHPEGKPTPEILEDAERVELPGLDRDKVIELKLDGTQDEDLYHLLLLAQCNALHQAMPFLFEMIGDETELLLPANLLHTDSLIRQLVEQVDEALWQEIEIIGWLYQFYISEKQKDVVGLGKVVKSEDIPAATQLFTPSWIVKYMVQNSLGAQWLSTYPHSPLKGQMEYYIEPAEQTDDVKAQLAAITPSALNPEELTLIDPASGSGHILVKAYELFKAIYLERGYRQRDVAQLILEKNLFGLDIDARAAQLTGFALVMKGRADDRRLFERGVKLNVTTLVDSAGFDAEGLVNGVDLGEYGLKPGDLTELKRLFEYATTFGSLIQVPEELAEKLPALKQLSGATSQDMFVSEAIKRLGPLVRQAELLAAQYDAVVANPPYMGGKGMNSSLKKFITDNFADAKSDLFACFIERGIEFGKPHARSGFMSPQVWMFLSSYEELRTRLIDQTTITALVQPEYNAFWDSAHVTICSYIIWKSHIREYEGTFIRLTDFYGAELQPRKTLEAIKNPDCGWLYRAQPDEFKKIPGSPVAYWLSNNERACFGNKYVLGALSIKSGLLSGNDELFLRSWTEVSYREIDFQLEDEHEMTKANPKWLPVTGGGKFRKWFGNLRSVVNARDNFHAIRTLPGNNFRLRDPSLYFRKSVNWPMISSSYYGAKISPRKVVLGNGVRTGFLQQESKSSEEFVVAYLSSCVATNFLAIINPTLNFNNENVAVIPFNYEWDTFVHENARRAVAIAESDWNLNECSWQFSSLPILYTSTASEPAPTLESSYTAWITQNRDTIAEMKRLEEENNRLFIDAYGLADELTPDVPIEQITLTVNPAYRYGVKLTEEELWTRFREDTMEELVSYAIGCMMGRYSLDQAGLIYAHSGNVGFEPTKYTTFPADEDGIIPITDMPWFSDDAANRFEQFIKTAWPEDHRQENMKFVAESLDQRKGETTRDCVRRYLATGFYKHHLSMYKKRPIYWLFSSGKQRAFQSLVYLHRYNAGTLSRMRTEYVVKLQGKFNARIEQLENDIPSAGSTSHRKKLEKERDTLIKQREELQTFDEKLRHYADQRIELDLDDGVKVNYGKFGDLLAEVKAITGGKE